jgi:hypothetical protein
MRIDELRLRLAGVVAQKIPLPGSGHTADRHRSLAEIAREDLSLAKLAEAHWDAVAILAEIGRTVEPNKLYAVWASEIPGHAIRLERTADGYQINGSKPFCSGIGIVDRALLTVGLPEPRLVEVDLRSHQERISTDLDIWKTDAFRTTQTGAITFQAVHLSNDSLIGDPGWYLEKPGFWHGACGPAACWAGGVAASLNFAFASKREDSHTLAHLGAMRAGVWGMDSLLKQAGDEIDAAPFDSKATQIRALQVRHLIEQMGTEILQRFSRAYGPYPLTMNAETSRRYQEAGIYMRQSHAERDLEALGCLICDRERSQTDG